MEADEETAILDASPSDMDILPAAVDDDDLEDQLTMHFALRAIGRTLFSTAWQLDLQDLSVLWLTLEKQSLSFGLDEIRFFKSFVDFKDGEGAGGGGATGAGGGGVRSWKEAKTTRDLRGIVEDFLKVISWAEVNLF